MKSLIVNSCSGLRPFLHWLERRIWRFRNAYAEARQQPDRVAPPGRPFEHASDSGVQSCGQSIRYEVESFFYRLAPSGRIFAWLRCAMDACILLLTGAIVLAVILYLLSWVFMLLQWAALALVLYLIYRMGSLWTHRR